MSKALIGWYQWTTGVCDSLVSGALVCTKPDLKTECSHALLFLEFTFYMVKVLKIIFRLKQNIFEKRIFEKETFEWLLFYISLPF